jgi:hypothetical protein
MALETTNYRNGGARRGREARGSSPSGKLQTGEAWRRRRRGGADGGSFAVTVRAREGEIQSEKWEGVATGAAHLYRGWGAGEDAPTTWSVGAGGKMAVAMAVALTERTGGSGWR